MAEVNAALALLLGVAVLAVWGFRVRRIMLSAVLLAVVAGVLGFAGWMALRTDHREAIVDAAVRVEAAKPAWTDAANESLKGLEAAASEIRADEGHRPDGPVEPPPPPPHLSVELTVTTFKDPKTPAISVPAVSVQPRTAQRETKISSIEVKFCANDGRGSAHQPACIPGRKNGLCSQNVLCPDPERTIATMGSRRPLATFPPNFLKTGGALLVMIDSGGTQLSCELMIKAVIRSGTLPALDKPQADCAPSTGSPA